MKSDIPQKPLRVLSLDGGGVRGLYTATLLKGLAQSLRGKPVDIGSAFDVIVGTSTGGILATALALGIPIQQIMTLYREIGPKIFIDPQPSPTISNLKFPQGSFIRKTVWGIRSFIPIFRDPFVKWCRRNLLKAANNPEPLRLELTRLFEDTTFGQLYEDRKIGLCLTAVKVSNEKLRVFKTPHDPNKTDDINLKLVDACMATSAAPLYLPLAVIPNSQTPECDELYADGGLAVNNPVLIGLTEALHQIGDTKRPIELFSIGTCAAQEGSVVPRSEADRGLAQWKVGTKALGMAMNAQASAANFAVDYLAQWLCKHSGNSVKLIRFPEAQRSEDHMQFLKMDNASERCCQALMQFGSDDAMAAKSHCDKADDPVGVAIKNLFLEMKESK